MSIILFTGSGLPLSVGYYRCGNSGQLDLSDFHALVLQRYPVIFYPRDCRPLGGHTGWVLKPYCP